MSNRIPPCRAFQDDQARSRFDDQPNAPGASNEPQVSDSRNGFGKLPIDFARALFMTIGSYRGLLLEHLLERSWWAPIMTKRPGEADPDPIPVHVSLAELGRAAGVGLNRLSEAKARLIRDGLLLEHSDGRLQLNTDYTTWSDAVWKGHKETRNWCLEGAHLLDQVRSGDVASEDRRSSGPDPKRTSATVHTPRPETSGKAHTPCSEASGKPHTPGPETSGKPHTETSAKADTRLPGTSGKADDPPGVYKERDLLSRGGEGTPAGAHAREGNPLPTSPLPDSGPISRRDQIAASLDGRLPGQHVPDRQILDHAIRLIETYCPLNAVQHGLTQHERVFPSEWIHRATRRAILQAQGKGQLARIRWSWMQRILKEWDFLGEPDPGVEDDYDRNLQYLPTSQRTSHRPAPTIAQRAPSRVPLQPPRRPQLSEEQLERQGREALAFLAAKLNRIPPPTTGAQASNRESNATVPSPATSRQPSSENRGNRVGDLLPPFPAMQNEPAQPVVS